MPNWCNNSVTLRFPTKEEAKDFSEHLDRVQSEEQIKDEFENDLTVLGYFVPEPDYNHDDQGWYWWRVNNWGTKWDISLYHHEWVDDCEIVLGFDTAWSPPIHVYEAMDEQGVNVFASYWEGGMCFAGRWELGEEEHYDYSSYEDPDELREFIGEDLDDEWGISDMVREYIEEEAEMNSDSGVENFGRN